MKPYTLEWWIDIMFQSIEEQESAMKYYNKHIGTDLQKGWWDKYQYKRNVGEWIYNRIIKNYGENQ